MTAGTDSNSAAELGGRLRRRYENCADLYVRIARAAGGQSTERGELISQSINLGGRTIRSLGRVCNSAKVIVTTYQPEDDIPNSPLRFQHWRPPIPFGVQVNYLEGKGQFAGYELFGAPACNFAGMRMPGFVRKPGMPVSYQERPWRDEADLYDYEDGDYPWTIDSYGEVRRRLLGMLEGAEDTQKLLVASLKDPRLNARFMQAAAGL